MSTLEKALEYLKPFIESQVALTKPTTLIRRSTSTKPLIIGIEGPQGSGKTWLASHLNGELSESYPTLNIVNFSMDDFYLTYKEQTQVTLKNSDNLLLKGRGLPGTHDLDLLKRCLDKIVSGEKQVSIPVYDKSLQSGKGDRLPFDQWLHVEKKIDVVIFEGWFNGYLANDSEGKLLKQWTEIQIQHAPKFDLVKGNHIIKLNSDLKKYEQVWKYFNCFVYVTTPRLDNVYTWRLQQEHDLISKRGSGMADKEVEAFVDRYMPAYHLYYHNLSDIEGAVLNCKHFEIGIDRQILHRESNM